MTFASQLDQLQIGIRHTRDRLVAPLDFRQHQLPDDPEIFVEDVLHYVMDECAKDLKELGHVLEHDTSWKDPENRYPLYLLRIAGGEVLNLHFTGDYPETLYLTISKGLRRTEQFSDARMAHVTLAVSMDANRLLLAILDGLNRFGH
ncbi:MAG: hypothetical protein IPH05_13685 [Flavobacteriales bacterium]|jgi:hypothetical protein|nr:hypothetical protein [Flavobacteriales bacterium]MBK6549451.1 hypothetical protein [Flavobacteriales bacterium]MBK6883963.1 hypothetical protein [Flavobacteriales bacterium]MBK7100353.1 hypothetical protein [Flavobacteriales bacterium]MBK7111047.1 hypothetical protein [Flavobacteriales bacterium]